MSVGLKCMTFDGLLDTKLWGPKIYTYRENTTADCEITPEFFEKPSDDTIALALRYFPKCEDRIGLTIETFLHILKIVDYWGMDPKVVMINDGLTKRNFTMRIVYHRKITQSKHYEDTDFYTFDIENNSGTTVRRSTVDFQRAKNFICKLMASNTVFLNPRSINMFDIIEQYLTLDRVYLTTAVFAIERSEHTNPHSYNEHNGRVDYNPFHTWCVLDPAIKARSRYDIINNVLVK